MFQKLNSMFSGNASSVLSQEPEFSEKEDDDEWVLIDFVVDPCTRLSEEAAMFEEIPSVDETPVLSCTTAFERLGNLSDSCFVHYSPYQMEESWFVTPPPCFTAGDLTTLQVETSPLENLLIEHPSMSVYAVHNLCHKEEADCESEFQSSNSLGLDAPKEKTVQHAHCYIAALAAHINFIEQTKTYLSSKLSKRQFERNQLNRKSLRRQNLVRGCHPRQIKHSGLVVHQPCQRQYNY
ncbi:tumor protein p53-inducible nuclear protein 1 [Bombina bombina]|uniref:tumor protein p53-inducible nuclear protein 1 n=1 Tax=Bombina bombina TaxID=8345 RepID=UPI00235A6D4C|nr:tumor protein p53-inducible nuclear protein 1 [Bombina bombina]